MMNLRLLSLLSLSLLAVTACTKSPVPRAPEGIFTIKLDPNPGKAVPVYVSAFAPAADGTLVKVASNKALPDGEASFVLPLDKSYSIQCYADINLDGRRNPEEPFVKVDGVKPHLPLATGPEAAPIVLTLSGSTASQASTQVKTGNASGTKGGGSAPGNSAGMNSSPAKAAAPAPPVPKSPESLPVPPPPAQ